MPASLTSQRLSDPWYAEDSGLIASNFDHWMTDTAAIATAGTIYLQRILIRRAKTVSNVKISITAAAVTVTANQNFVAIVDASGNILASSAAGAIDALITGTGEITLPLSTPVKLSKGTYYVALLFNATTPPTIHRTGLTNAPMLNMGTSAANFRAAINGTLATALPASFNLANNTAGVSYWVGLT